MAKLTRKFNQLQIKLPETMLILAQQEMFCQGVFARIILYFFIYLVTVYIP